MKKYAGPSRLNEGLQYHKLTMMSDGKKGFRRELSCKCVNLFVKGNDK